MGSSYGWIITKDHLASSRRDEAGVCGPRDLSSDMKNVLLSGTGEAFKMYDDDRELYYEGLIVGDYSGFEPLDDFGGPNAGCTYIMYKNKQTGKFDVL